MHLVITKSTREHGDDYVTATLWSGESSVDLRLVVASGAWVDVEEASFVHAPDALAEKALEILVEQIEAGQHRAWLSKLYRNAAADAREERALAGTGL